jgi:hypothetical protein
MGLDAVVYCDCYEKGRLRVSPPVGALLHIAVNGALECDSDRIPFDAVLAFDEWRASKACGHEKGILLQHRLGNTALVALLRSELQREPNRFPILLTKVVHSGIHGGDYLPIETIPELQRELDLLSTFKCSTREADEFMSQFKIRMVELASTALSVTKPIAF